MKKDKIDQDRKGQEKEIIGQYKVIYRLSEDLRQIARSLAPMEEQEKRIGKARVIALFKSSRKDIILGCEVMEGRLAIGDPFRIISAMGQVFTGHIESLHIEKDAVKKATVGQQVGIKVPGFNRGRVGDWVECFETVRARGPEPWRPRGVSGPMSETVGHAAFQGASAFSGSQEDRRSMLAVSQGPLSTTSASTTTGSLPERITGFMSIS